MNGGGFLARDGSLGRKRTTLSPSGSCVSILPPSIASARRYCTPCPASRSSALSRSAELVTCHPMRATPVWPRPRLCAPADLADGQRSRGFTGTAEHRERVVVPDNLQPQPVPVEGQRAPKVTNLQVYG